MSRIVPFAQADVFAHTPYRGNPVAVILDATGLGVADMQAIARWTHLSETTFVLPPSDPRADYRVRIFTPGREVPFAGHPTLGTACAWLDAGGTPHANLIVQECGAGLVELRRRGETLAFAAPRTVRTGGLTDTELDTTTAALGVDRRHVVAHQWVDNGPGWAAVQLASAAEVRALHPDFSRAPDAMVGVIGAWPDGSPHAFEIRAFAPGVGVAEDPVTGSLNASVAQWFARRGCAPTHYTVTQGACVGSDGEITIEVEDGAVWVGGVASVRIRGTIGV